MDRPVGIIVPLFDALLRISGYLCPSKIVFFIAKRRGLNEESVAKGFDFYILTWFGLEFLLVILAGTTSVSPTTSIILCAILMIRVFEILNIAASILLYGRFREGDDYVVSSVRRTILINVLNSVELVFLFSIVYYMGFNHMFKPPLVTIWDSCYFSAVTVTTLGYGDHVPNANLSRFFTAIQVISGFFFVILIFGRVISLLPRPKYLDDGIEDK